jgi:apolipoprotein N-acyltransferase
MEWLKAHFPLGLSFPWLGLGISLTSWPHLLGLAEWTGERGVSFWLAAVNGLLASAVLGVTDNSRGSGAFGRSAGLALLAGGMALVPAILGVLRANHLPLRAGPTVAVVGTNVPRTLRLRPDESSEEGLAQAREALRPLRPGSADLVVLPEATVSVPLDHPENGRYLDMLGEMAQALEAPILVGALGGTGSATAQTNSAFLVGLEGSLEDRYDKVRLVPGMEGGELVPGRPGAPVGAGGFNFGPLICYESLFGGLARAQRLAGAKVLANLSSDVWFGEGVGGFSSIFLHQHAAHMAMRAVENRMAVARAANGGFSTLLDPSGSSVAEAVPPTGGLALAPVPVMDGFTLYSRIGDLVGSGTALFCLLVLGSLALRPEGDRVRPGPRREAERLER